jgi:hypothetical protein
MGAAPAILTEHTNATLSNRREVGHRPADYLRFTQSEYSLTMELKHRKARLRLVPGMDYLFALLQLPQPAGKSERSYF